jgi:hypothetical protein
VARFPYPGLRPFERDDADIFFGRETHVDSMVNRLAQRRMLAVTGSSGSGKSSLVRAGLLEALETGLMAEAGPLWRFAILRPGDHPMTALAAGLIDAYGDTNEPGAVALRRAALERGPLSLIDELRERPLPNGANLLVLADQFEELFRYQDLAGREEAEVFIGLLLASASQRQVPIYVVLTMRSDFFGECAQFEGLPEAICDSLYLCPRLTREQVIAAIEGPAQVFGGRVEPALAARLANDMGNNPDQLPLMQHALMRLWDQAQLREPAAAPLLGLDGYLAADGLHGSLSRHADEILDAVSRDAPERREVARRLFCLITEGGGDRAVRRLAPVSEVVAVSERPLEDVARIADAYRAPSNSLLMPPLHQALTPGTVLDISHEALIRNWQTLNEWVREEQASAARYRAAEQRTEQILHGDTIPWEAHEPRAILAWIEQDRPNAAWAARYGGNFEQLRNAARAAAARQTKAIWAARLVLAVNTIGAITDILIFKASTLIWLVIIGAIYGTVQRNLTRSFITARSWAIIWIGFLSLLVTYGGFQNIQGHVTPALFITEAVLVVVVACLVYICFQLQRLSRRRRPHSAAEPDFSPQRRRLARFALLVTIGLIIAIGLGQAAYSVVHHIYLPRPGSGLDLADAGVSLIIAGIFYATTSRNLPRNLALTRGASGVWLFLVLFTILENVNNGDRALAAADCLPAASIAVALISLMPGLRLTMRSGRARNTAATGQVRS